MEMKRLYERDKEVQQLRKIFLTAKQEGSLEVVFVSGPCGTGKTTLVEETFKKENCLYGYGKFEREKVNLPFSSLSSCVSALGQSILETDTKKYADLIKSSLTPNDIQMLLHLVPGLNAVVPEYTQECTIIPGKATKDSLEHFKFALRLLLRTISIPDRPVVLYVDDVQWIDEMTMEILKAILSDPDIQHFMLVGAYREEDVDAEHKVSAWIEKGKIDIIQVGNFRPDQVRAVLADMLETKEDIQELADLFHNRTRGNILHIIHLFEYIKAHNKPKLLEYSPIRFKYVWNIEDIRRYTSLSDNVVDMIVTKIHQLPEAAQSVLKLASCFGSCFDQKILQVLEVQNLSSSFEVAIEQGLLERLSDNGVIKFVHDKVHNAALDLIPDEEQTKMHFDIGKKLLDHFCGVEDEFSGMDDSILFTCVDQLNIGKDLIDSKNFRLRLAKLNHEAIVRAASYSAFLAAIRYAEIGISLLDQKTMWADDYSFCLELHTLLAEMCSSCGKIERLDRSTKEVVIHARSIEDKLRVYFASLSGKAKEIDGVNEEFFPILEELGESVPKDIPKCNAMSILGRTNHTLESLSDDEVLALQPMKCIKKSAAIRLVSSIFRIMIQGEMFCRAAMLLGRMVATTLKEGLSEYAPVLFAHYGYILMSFDSDINIAWRMGSLAIQLLEKEKSPPRVRIGVLSQTAYFTNWQQPLSLHLDKRIETYQESLRLGDLEGAFQFLSIYGMEYFYSGLPLAPLVRDMKKFLEQMASYDQLVLLFINLPLYQTILNLTGGSEKILDVSTAKETVELRRKYSWDGKTGLETNWSYGMQIAFFCGDMEKANAYAKNLKNTSTMSKMKRIPWYFGQVRIFFFALISIEKFRKTGKSKYLREAKKYKALIEGYVREGSINLPHKLQILEAELASVKDPCPFSRAGQVSLRNLANVKNPKSILRQEHNSVPSLQSMYDEAIARSRRSGFLQDAALCALLASRAVNVGDDRYHLLADELLESWGATAIKKHLQNKRLSLVSVQHTESNSTLSDRSTGYRAKSRFTEGIQKDGLEFASDDIPFIQAT